MTLRSLDKMQLELLRFNIVQSIFQFVIVRPEFTDTLAIKQGRHPILEKVSPHKVMVPNDSVKITINTSGSYLQLHFIYFHFSGLH